MDQGRLAQRLMATFLGELQEHVRALERDLLALERDPEPAARTELYKALFRAAHSLKGAACSVGVSEVEAACHQLEEIFAAAREGGLPVDAALFRRLFATVDTLVAVGERLRAAQAPAVTPSGTLTPPPAITPPQPSRPDVGSAPEELPTHAAQPSSVRLRSDDLVRVPADRLDALLTQSSELLVARRRAEARLADIATLQETLSGWQPEWRSLEKVLAKRLPSTSDPDPGPANGNGAVAPLPRRVKLAIGQSQHRLRQLEKHLQHLAKGLSGDHYALEQVAGSLDAEIRRVRMLPFAEACAGLERMVRDLTADTGKHATVVVQGGAIELDRSILEGLKDPLVHLVRNAVDHGIEPVAVRRAAGKPENGRITVSAALRDSHVEVAVADDGGGLDLEAIRAEARKKHLPEPTDERELAQPIFLAGFSTSAMITQISGRGVGLDVVKSRVEAMRGRVDVAFAPGRGTQFLLTLPLTLTTLRALLISAGQQTFALDTACVHKLLRVGAADLRSIEGREVLPLSGAPVPVFALADLLGLRGGESAHGGEKRPAALLASGHDQAVMVVDELLAEHEVVVRSLGPRLGGVRHFSGALVLPTGRIALILNAAEILRSALEHDAVGKLSEALAPPRQAAKKRLLVVDDSVTTRTLEKSILEAAGYQVLAAADGAEAWQLLQHKGADLVVTDVEMPRMDGFALTEAIRDSARFKRLPVVLVTALETEQDKARGMQVGADAYLLKSAFDQSDLLQTIEQIL